MEAELDAPGPRLAPDPPGIRVDVLISGLMFGGGQRVVLDLLDKAREASGVGGQLVLLGCREPALERPAASVVPYDGRYDRPNTLLRTSRHLRRRLRQEQPAILHTHGWDADVIGWLSTTGQAIARIVHLHITPPWLASPYVKHRVRRLLTRRAFSGRAVRLVAVCDAVRRYWARLLPWDAEAITVIHNGIDVRRFVPAPPAAHGRRPVVGAAARLAPMKGLHHLLEAMAAAQPQGVNADLRIAGEGELREALEQQARSLGIGERVTFLGRIERMPEFYRSIDVYVLPSVDTEGLPLGALEAMASGLPVVATAVGGAAEAVRDGVDGIIVAPGDAATLAQALSSLLADREVRTRMGESARLRAVEVFSLERFAGEVFDLYRDTVKQMRR